MLNARKFLSAAEKLEPSLVQDAAKVPWYSKVFGNASINRAENAAKMTSPLPYQHPLTPHLENYTSNAGSLQALEHSGPFKLEHTFNKLPMWANMGIFGAPSFIPGFYPEEAAKQGTADANVPTSEDPPIPTNYPQQGITQQRTNRAIPRNSYDLDMRSAVHAPSWQEYQRQLRDGAR